MTRVMLMTFFGEKRWAEQAHPHEAPAVMTAPMILLAVGSVASGGLLAVGGTLSHWLEPVVGAHEEAHAVPVVVATALILAVVAVGIGVAYRMYARRAVPEEVPTGSALTVAARRDLYGDALNERVFMRPGQTVTALALRVDDEAVDGAATGLGALVAGLSNRLQGLQTGFARNYALSMLGGATLIVAVILAVNLW
jgi:NADH-quinone oxidoreductase subunit L